MNHVDMTPEQIKADMDEKHEQFRAEQRAKWKRYTYDQMAAFAKANPDAMYNVVGAFDEHDDDDDLRDNLTSLHGETSAAMRKWMTTFAHFYMDDDGITFDPSRLQLLSAIASLVSAEYEWTYDEHDYKYHPIWTAFELSSDDDVDYAGSYIDCMIDLLELMMKADIPSVEF